MNLLPNEEIQEKALFNFAPMMDFLFLMMALFAVLAISRSSILDTNINLYENGRSSTQTAREMGWPIRLIHTIEMRLFYEGEMNLSNAEHLENALSFIAVQLEDRTNVTLRDLIQQRVIQNVNLTSLIPFYERGWLTVYVDPKRKKESTNEEKKQPAVKTIKVEKILNVEQNPLVEQRNRRFNLVGFVVLQNRHLTLYTKHRLNNQWYHVDSRSNQPKKVENETIDKLLDLPVYLPKTHTNVCVLFYEPEKPTIEDEKKEG